MEKVFEWKKVCADLYQAISMLPEKQQKRIIVDKAFNRCWDE